MQQVDEVLSPSDLLKPACGRRLGNDLSSDVSSMLHLELLGVPPRPVQFSRYEDFLALTEKEMLHVIQAVARARAQYLIRLFSANFGKDVPVEEIGVEMVAKTLLAVASDLARITASGQIECDADMSLDVGIFTNVLVQNKVQEATPLIQRVVGKFLGELHLLASQSG